LPFHHADPFDRVLVAQAIEHGLRVATRDGVFGAYGVSVLKV
jgi:PIN domain nuclease of toxin-antitoxin system